MRHKDPDLMIKICEFVDEYYLSEGCYPSTTEIGKGVGIARATAYNYLVEMKEKGMIQYDGKTIITDKMLKTSANNPSMMMNASISCGLLQEENDTQIEEYVNLPVSIFGNKDLFLLRANGESMIEAGIEPGDIVVVEKNNTANIGDIVVALGNENGNSLKRLTRKNNKYVLHPENKEMEDIIVDSLEIQGIARFVIKKL